MPQSHTGLWPQLIAWDNLVRAYQRCRRRKRNSAAATAFDFAWETELLTLADALASGRYVPGPYRHFWIHDPKPRKISAAPFRDRVVHHALVQVIEPVFERGFITDSYACRRGRGTHRAIARARHYLHRHRYFLKTDIVRFFPNVDHAVMRVALARRIADPRVLALIDTILASGAGVLAEQATPTYFPGDDLFAISRPTGLPIGNLTSQFFANVLLDRVDHAIKERLCVPGYVRYADDLLLFGDDKRQLWQWRDRVAAELAALRLRLHPDKTRVGRSRDEVVFLGWRLSGDSQRLCQTAIRRFSRRIRHLRWARRTGRITPADVTRSVQAWLAHARHGHTQGLKRVILRRARM